MSIRIEGARENNLRDISVSFPPGITAVTGISGSGKSSLVFDTLYSEAQRRFFEIYAAGRERIRSVPAAVDAVHGLMPAVAIAQDSLNRNPASTVATASGVHPFLRLLFANYGTRDCPHCGADVQTSNDDAVLASLIRLAADHELRVSAPLLHNAPGSHATLLRSLYQVHSPDRIVIKQKRGDIELIAGHVLPGLGAHETRAGIAEALETAAATGSLFIRCSALRSGQEVSNRVFARDRVCYECGRWYDELRPVVFHQSCPYCEGAGCERCGQSGNHPDSLSVTWNGLGFAELLSLSAIEFTSRMETAEPGPLQSEILKRSRSICDLGLGYLSMNRPSPSLSRGESQRLRLSVCLTSRLELLHVLDEPTIGLHPTDTESLFHALRRLSGPIVVVEHDRVAAHLSDHCVDIGPGAGSHGGEVVFAGTPEHLMESATLTGKWFSQPPVGEKAPRVESTGRIHVHCARAHNLKDIDVQVPTGMITAVTGVSGSGKSSLVHHVVGKSLTQRSPVNCDAIETPVEQCVVVDQGPIGRNPRSNPATYTKLADVIRDAFAKATGRSKSEFSFNRKEGSCPRCAGLGAEELSMRYLPSIWLQCPRCRGRRFNDEVLAETVWIGGEEMSIADLYERRIDDIAPMLLADPRENDDRSTGRLLTLPPSGQKRARAILEALHDIGLGYLTLGQPSPTLSGGEAQRVKLARYLGQNNLHEQVLILDEPSTGLHPADVASLVTILKRLRSSGSTVIVVEHNLDVVRACDWVIDLGPGPGPDGGEVVYQGDLEGLADADSPTGRALGTFAPESGRQQANGKDRSGDPGVASAIAIRGADLHNLKHIDVDIPLGKLTVVTGVSGSGKSSLVRGVLENEARRRFLETLSIYERQSISDTGSATGADVSGLGVTLSVGAQRYRYDPRSTIGTMSEIVHKLSLLYSFSTSRRCEECGEGMVRSSRWQCGSCGASAPVLSSNAFFRTNYHSACTTCNGVGTRIVPSPDKLIVHPEKPICGGAMYSPGFFPKGYLCKPFNGGYYLVQAVAEMYGFDPSVTPWNRMSEEARNAFLYGVEEELTVHYESKKGHRTTRRQRYPGFYGFLGDWDVGGTYSDTVPCEACEGTGLRASSVAVRFAGHSIHELNETPLADLLPMLSGRSLSDEIVPDAPGSVHAAYSTAIQRLDFLVHAGLGYLHLNRLDATLSAGESQRVRLARLLGSGLSRLTVLLDEPSRGMHPSEVAALVGVLRRLRDDGNTVIVVEHDLEVVANGDHILEMGPGSGASGGRVVYQGKPSRRVGPGELQMIIRSNNRRKPGRWMRLTGARENNLADLDLDVPLGLLTGICGVSGSGKSTLVVDTLARIVAPASHTTSVAQEPLSPGEYDALKGAPDKALVIDQSRAGVVTPGTFLGLDTVLARAFANTDEAAVLGLSAPAFRRNCSGCGGSGRTTVDMGFLPNIHPTCELCGGSGYRPEVLDVRLSGLTIAEVGALSFDEMGERLADERTLANRISVVQSLGLGYLVFHQPGIALSGGEVQRLKIIRELSKRSANLYILDEPTVGQSLVDVARLIEVLRRLVEDGRTVVVVEHHPHLLASCDWLVELGPGAGPDGGRIVATGSPEAVASGTSATAPYLRELLEAV